MSRPVCVACERGEPEKCTTWAVEGGVWMRCSHPVNVRISRDGSAFLDRHGKAS